MGFAVQWCWLANARCVVIVDLAVARNVFGDLEEPGAAATARGEVLQRRGLETRRAWNRRGSL